MRSKISPTQESSAMDRSICAPILNRDRQGADAIVRQRSIQFIRAKVWSESSEVIGNRRKKDASIHGARSRLQSEIKILRLVKMLRIGLVRNPDLHKNIEINQNTVPLLPCRLTVLLERLEVASHRIVLIVGRNFEWRRVPLKGILHIRIWAEAIVIGSGVIRVSA